MGQEVSHFYQHERNKKSPEIIKVSGLYSQRSQRVPSHQSQAAAFFEDQSHPFEKSHHSQACLDVIVVSWCRVVVSCCRAVGRGPPSCSGLRKSCGGVRFQSAKVRK
jgi:hypothetical protein